MFLDNETKLSDSQALTATALATDVYDLEVVRAMGNGEPLSVVVVINVDADQTSGDEDYTFDLEVATDSGITTGRQLLARRIYESGTPTAPAQDADLLVQGYKVVLPIPVGSLGDSAQYIGVRYTLAGTTPTATVTAFIQPNSMIEASDGIAYASGFTVS